jgi:hypothetical protein
MTTIQQLPAQPADSDDVLNLTSRTGPAPLMGPADPGTAIALMGPAVPGTATPLMGRAGPGAIAPLMGCAVPTTAIAVMGPADPTGTPLMGLDPATPGLPGPAARPQPARYSSRTH